MNNITIIGLTLTLVGLGCTIWALSLSMKQTNEAKRMQTHLEKQLRQLAGIHEALTTRFIGAFPEYIPHIISLLEGAERELIIFCDLPAYGSFTSHDNHIKYRQTIERKIFDGKNVELTFLNKGWRDRVLDEQFHFEGNEWESWKVEKEKLLDEFLAHYGSDHKRNELTKEGFSQIVDRLNNRLLSEEFLNKAKEVGAFMPLLFWLIDDKEAVFAIPVYKRDVATLGFRTSDQSLIEAFKEMSKRYRQRYTEDTD